MDRLRKLELIQRTLAIRHKIKVHESMKPPETHEDLAVMLLARWELEDELRAIEELLGGARDENVKVKKDLVKKNILAVPKGKKTEKKKSPGNTLD
ncbi:MAG: hypothetical protein AB7F66_00565 [Bacteriovoracia bacterium]